MCGFCYTASVHSINMLKKINGIFQFVLLSLFCWVLADCQVIISTSRTNNNEHTRAVVLSGASAILYCHFVKDSAKLYTLKWYKDGQEFYRFTPPTSIRVFDIPDHHVSKERSNVTHIFLTKINRKNNGTYSCETTENDTLLTTIEETTLLVVERSAKDTSITGLKSSYQVESSLTANCTYEKSFPAANLTWFVNRRRVNGPFVRAYRPVVYPSPKGLLFTARSTLQMQVHESHFINRFMEIQCEASIYGLTMHSRLKRIHKGSHDMILTKPTKRPRSKNSNPPYIYENTNRNGEGAIWKTSLFIGACYSVLLVIIR